ncbi:hypothetical protein ccbrp13_01430 [Ktedonobacteria bacterium brp13]|nr:hypothetical protein ccbrp13_01430 [Ktedonobacteria bacterium brp13]
MVNEPVHIQPKDTIHLLGYEGGPLPWSQQHDSLVITIPPAAQQSDQYAWVFKIAWS